MDWTLISWTAKAVLAVYFVVQVLAIVRLQGQPRRKSVLVALWMVAAEGAAVWIHGAESIRVATIAAVCLGLLAVGAAAFLVGMLIRQSQGARAAGVTQW